MIQKINCRGNTGFLPGILIIITVSGSLKNTPVNQKMKNLEERHVLQGYHTISVLGTNKSEPQARRQVCYGMRKRNSIIAKSSWTFFSLCFLGESKRVRQRDWDKWAMGRMVWFDWAGKHWDSNDRDQGSILFVFLFVYSCNTQFPVYTKLLGYEK